jgi:hypothetical protein
LVQVQEKNRMNRIISTSKFLAIVTGLCLLFSAAVFAQETTGGLQGTVKDPSGAVVSKAHVVVSGSSLIGDKAADTDSGGYYRFANLPPGTYTVTATAKGFSTYKSSLVVEVGHLPTLDIALAVGAESTVVEVSGGAPLVDVTTNTNQTNVTEDMIDNAPHGLSFQSMIQFAPMARNEPLAGSQLIAGGTGGGALPGSSGNGGAVGFSIGGAADSESSYLVEGQDTENISGGASNANVPFEFIQEVQIKTSGIEAEHGGALGGVINVIMKKGGNAYHGSGFVTYGNNSMNGSPNNQLRYDPLGNLLPDGEDTAQSYSRKKDDFHQWQPGFTFGGPLKKDRLWFFAGFGPLMNTTARTVNFNPSVCSTDPAAAPLCINTALGNQTFRQQDKFYYATGRLDATVSQKIRLYGSWLYQYERLEGNALPIRDPDPGQNLLNESITVLDPLAQFSHAYGYSQPNATYNVGADITLTPKIVSTTRFGYFFTNYHDFGWPTSAPNLFWETSGVGASDNGGNPLPANVAQSGGFATSPYDQSYTLFNASKHFQFDQDVAFFKSGWGGTHNFKFGYQLNHLSNLINQNGNVPLVEFFPGSGQSYTSSTNTGGTNCGSLIAEWGNCAGQYGYVTVSDFATILPKPAVDWNHALFVQDNWTIGHGLTLNLGIRVERESLPVPSGLQQAGVVPPASINFPWSDKVAPRLGAAWGPANGKIKIFGSYGVVNDVMKLLLAQTSWGAQVFENCTYPLGPDGANSFSFSDITATFVNNRACPNGSSSTGANFTGGTVPASLTDAGTGVSLIENVNLRPWEPVAKGVKPYRQHEFVAGFDYQIAKDWAFEARYDRRRLDHVIEDASLADPSHFEMYTIVNPGEGVNSTVDGYANYLGSLGSAYGIPNFAFDPVAFGTCPSCPHLPKAIRNYDGAEMRLTKASSHGWAGMFSYTYSKLWGNYTGLTTTDQIDGGIVGRDSPDTTRAFDEPFYYFGANGKSNNGPLPTDRPNTFKGNVYYVLPWKGGKTTLGLFQSAYQGTPLSSYADIGLACCNEPIESVYVFGRGKMAPMSVDSAGNLTVGTPVNARTPWFTQSDLNVAHAIHVNKNNEHQLLTFQATFINVLNQHAVVSEYTGFSSIFNSSSLFPDQVFFDGAGFYQETMTGYNVQGLINSQAAGTCEACVIFAGGANPGVPLPLIKSSQYGQPNIWQLSRNVRLGLTFSF